MNKQENRFSISEIDIFEQPQNNVKSKENRASNFKLCSCCKLPINVCRRKIDSDNEYDIYEMEN